MRCSSSRKTFTKVRAAWPELWWRYDSHVRRDCRCSVWFSVTGFLHAKAESGICVFPVDSVTNFHIGGSKQHRFIIYSCGGQKSRMVLTGLKLRSWRGCVSSGSLENPIPCLFPLLQGAWPPWYMAPFLHLQCQQQPVKAYSHPIAMTLTPLLTSSTFQDSCDYFRHPGNPG